MNTISEYKQIIQSFRDYKIVSRITEPEGQLFIRHDVDFDLDLAVELAKIEYKMGVRAVYFVMVTSPYYNIFSEEFGIFEILELGHDVLLHYDHKFDWKLQLDIFTDFMGYCPDLISMHRPRNTDKLDANPIKIESTYSDRYSKDAKYFSDANCLWRYGYPEPQVGLRTVQLMTHPVWWMIEGEGEAEKCANFIKYREGKLKKELHKSLRTYV